MTPFVFTLWIVPSKAIMADIEESSADRRLTTSRHIRIIPLSAMSARNVRIDLSVSSAPVTALTALTQVTALTPLILCAGQRPLHLSLRIHQMASHKVARTHF